MITGNDRYTEKDLVRMEMVMKEDTGIVHSQDITLSRHTIHFWKGGAGPGVNVFNPSLCALCGRS